jgi:hypothetical protein
VERDKEKTFIKAYKALCKATGCEIIQTADGFKIVEQPFCNELKLKPAPKETLKEGLEAYLKWLKEYNLKGIELFYHIEYKINNNRCPNRFLNAKDEWMQKTYQEKIDTVANILEKKK